MVTKKRLLEQIQSGKVLVADGAMGTMLMERGLRPGEPPESFNLTRTSVLEEIARLYCEAGADLIQTNTFGASSLKLSAYGLADRTEEVNRNAVQAVKRAVGGQAYIYASCGPTGTILKPYGDTETENVYQSFAQQMNVLVSAGVDAICIETMIDLNEAQLAIKAARAVAADMPIIATMTFDTTPRGFFTVMGVSIEMAVRGLEEAGADIIGSNCGNGIENMVSIAREFKKKTERALIVQSNAGLPELRNGVAVYPETPAFMAEKAAELVSIGVSIIGGCCGTTPAHIRALRNVVDAHHH
jgi:5-methyltetrahydrofolate--homocysteine methyltransferase